jgi:amino acid transporter
MLNGAYSIGAVDVITHLAEEIPNPQRNVPIGMALQLSIGFSTGFCYLVAIMYAISDLSVVAESAYPITKIYEQATGSAAGASGMLALIMLNIGSYHSSPSTDFHVLECSVFRNASLQDP